MGRPVVHWELMSKDPAKVAAFYETIFGWKIQHMPEMDYRLVETGGAGGINGGILKPQPPEPWPGNMTFYIDWMTSRPTTNASLPKEERFTWRTRRCPAWAHSRSS